MIQKIQFFILVFIFSNTSSAADFITVYTDQTGLQWSQNLGIAHNCGKTSFFKRDELGNRKIGEGSEAVQLCEGIGGKLPTKMQYINLLRDFDHTEQMSPDAPLREEYISPNLTQQGHFEFKNIFRFSINKTYWTSSADAKLSYPAAHRFDINECRGCVPYWGHGCTANNAVRCVR